jgi:hypothetical protein
LQCPGNLSFRSQRLRQRGVGLVERGTLQLGQTEIQQLEAGLNKSAPIPFTFSAPIPGQRRTKKAKAA